MVLILSFTDISREMIFYPGEEIILRRKYFSLARPTVKVIATKQKKNILHSDAIKFACLLVLFFFLLLQKFSQKALKVNKYKMP